MIFISEAIAEKVKRIRKEKTDDAIPEKESANPFAKKDKKSSDKDDKKNPFAKKEVQNPDDTDSKSKSGNDGDSKFGGDKNEKQVDANGQTKPADADKPKVSSDTRFTKDKPAGKKNKTDTGNDPEQIVIDPEIQSLTGQIR